MRILGAVTLALLAAGCFHDNASPFVHGAHNAPSLGGATHVTPAAAVTETTGTYGYGASSGYAGGVEKAYGVESGAAAGAAGAQANDVAAQMPQNAAPAPPTPQPNAPAGAAPKTAR